MAVFAQIEEKPLVKKLKAARDRKSAQQGRRIEGRKGYAETHPELVRIARRFTHGNRKQRLSLRYFRPTSRDGIHEWQRQALFRRAGQALVTAIIASNCYSAFLVIRPLPESADYFLVQPACKLAGHCVRRKCMRN